MENTARRIKFKPEQKSTFDKRVKDEVYSYFRERNISFNGDWRMVLKSIVIFSVLFGSYFLILSNQFTPLQMLGLCVLAGMSWAAAGMGIMHDACHSSYSSKKSVNRALGYTMNILGGNKYNWIIQHNIKHHTFTNIFGADEDLDNGEVIRLSPFSKRLKLHRFQHIYAWFLYALGTLSWAFIKDYKQFSYLRKELRPSGKKNYRKELTIMVFTKICYYFFLLVVPYLVLDLPFWMILVGFTVAHAVAGLILSVTFQLAHIVEIVDHHDESTCHPVKMSWAEHQLRTTANFCRNNRLLSWYVGGLNFQIEHHLFPNICHVHYYEISKIVKRVSAEYDIPYNEFTDLGTAIRSHYRSLKQLSYPVPSEY